MKTKQPAVRSFTPVIAPKPPRRAPFCKCAYIASHADAELAVAWANGNADTSSVRYQRKGWGDQVYSHLAVSLREAMNLGLLKDGR